METDIFQRVRKFKLPLGEYAVFGSGLLDVWGIRKANDLDIISTPALYGQLKSEGWEEKRGNGFTYVMKDDANVSTVQERPTDGDYFPDRLKLIKEAVVINGVPFVRIEEVIACKTAYGRAKDLADIDSINKYLREKEVAEIYKI